MGSMKPSGPVKLAVGARVSYLNEGTGTRRFRRSLGFGRARKDMGGFQQYFDIILFAMVAGFLVLRLRSVLGRRTGNERRRELFARRPAPAAEKVVTLVEPEKRSSRPVDEGSRGDVVAEGLKQIRRADPNFDPAHFIEGARAAFEMIVGGFAKGDKAALRPLLSDEVF